MASSAYLIISGVEKNEGIVITRNYENVKNITKLDENPYLICFQNGVYDFEQKLFRDGIPEDYVSKSTGIDYVDITKKEYKPIIALINDFMAKLFPPILKVLQEEKELI